MAERLMETAEGDIYEVFARFKLDEPLHHIGNVIAATADLARMYAYTMYDEWGWSEMIIVPRREMVTVVAVA
jgi:1,2-phenylacetyl-CoA epoxidase PaaB subunit